LTSADVVEQIRVGDSSRSRAPTDDCAKFAAKRLHRAASVKNPAFLAVNTVPGNI
jgi:hypothetical protein